MRSSFRGIAVGFLLIGAVGVPACSGGAAGDLAKGCKLNSDCSAPLVCAFSLCERACAESRDCPAGERCVKSGSTSVCQLSDDAECKTSADCLGDLVCGPDDQCRNPCAKDTDCIGGQVCVANVCAETSERQTILHDSGKDGGVALARDAGGTPDASVSSRAPGVDAAVHDAAPPRGPCLAGTLAVTCPPLDCRAATGCTVNGACVYADAPVTCGTCDLGLPTCTAGVAGCTDIDVLGVAQQSVVCDSTSLSSTFVYLDPAYAGGGSDGSRTRPFSTLAAAVAASSASPHQIIVAGNPTFTDPLVITNGLSIEGGFTRAWVRDLTKLPVWRVPASALSGSALAGMTAQNITTPTLVAHVEIRTDDLVTPSTSGAGASNYGVRAVNASALVLDDVTVIAGAAQAGAAGTTGSKGTNGKDPNGVTGACNTCYPTPCTPATPPDPPGGTNTCAGATTNPAGGAGGPTKGSAAPTGAKAGSTSNDAGNGAAYQTPGSAGKAASSGGSIQSNFFVPAEGAKTGAPGDAGPGGGGTADIDCFLQVCVGPSGGAGGCGGGGGGPGSSGGWSFGLFAVGSDGLRVRSSTIESGTGGDGGLGGPGGSGAAGGGGGAHVGCVGGASGHGASGQQGGSGGDGAGGSSVAVYCSGTTLSLEGTVSLTPGAPGQNGSGANAVGNVGCSP